MPVCTAWFYKCAHASVCLMLLHAPTGRNNNTTLNFHYIKSKEEPTGFTGNYKACAGSFYWKQSHKFGVWGNWPCWEEHWVKLFSIQLQDPSSLARISPHWSVCWGKSHARICYIKPLDVKRIQGISYTPHHLLQQIISSFTVHGYKRWIFWDISWGIQIKLKLYCMCFVSLSWVTRCMSCFVWNLQD